MIIENFCISKIESDWLLSIILVLFYICITFYVAYKYPINFLKIFGSTPNKSKNILLNMILVILFSGLFWILKIIELIINSSKKIISEKVKKGSHIVGGKPDFQFGVKFKKLGKVNKKKNYYDPIY